MDHRLRKNSQFNFIYKKGERFHTENFTLFVVKSKYECYRIGFSVNKKIGKANKRNLLKRRLKEITRKYVNVLAHNNYVVMAKENAVNSTFEELKNEMIRLFKKYENKKAS